MKDTLDNIKPLSKKRDLACAMVDRLNQHTSWIQSNKWPNRFLVNYVNCDLKKVKKITKYFKTWISLAFEVGHKNHSAWLRSPKREPSHQETWLCTYCWYMQHKKQSLTSTGFGCSFFEGLHQISHSELFQSREHFQEFQKWKKLLIWWQTIYLAS